MSAAFSIQSLLRFCLGLFVRRVCLCVRLCEAQNCPSEFLSVCVHTQPYTLLLDIDLFAIQPYIRMYGCMANKSMSNSVKPKIVAWLRIQVQRTQGLAELQHPYQS